MGLLYIICKARALIKETFCLKFIDRYVFYKSNKLIELDSLISEKIMRARQNPLRRFLSAQWSNKMVYIIPGNKTTKRSFFCQELAQIF